MNNLNACPICKSKEQALFITCKDYTVSQTDFQIMQCNDCGFRFTNPIPEESEIGAYYKSEEYISHSGTKKGLVNRLYHAVRDYTLGQKYLLLKEYAKSESILDIGCGSGDFLKYVHNQGWETLGLEPDDDARRYCLEHHKIDARPINTLQDLPADMFPVITMWHVLEHVYQLQDYLQKINEILKEDGTLFIAVPNCSSYDARKYGKHWAAYDVPRHLYHFQPQNIKDLVGQHDMEVIKVLPMKFDSYYVSLLSEKYRSGTKKIGLFSLIKGFYSGLISNLKASGNRYSSQIYVIQHKRK